MLQESESSRFQSFSEAQWKQIEENTVDYSSDLDGWLKKLQEEKTNIERRLEDEVERTKDWMEETDWLIRMLRICEEEVLTRMYQDQFDAQNRYYEKVKARKNLLDIKINEILKLQNNKKLGGKLKMA